MGPLAAIVRGSVPQFLGPLPPTFLPPPCFRAHMQKGLVLSEVFSHEVSILGGKVDRVRPQGFQGSSQVEIRIVQKSPIDSEKIRKLLGIKPRERHAVGTRAEGAEVLLRR